MLRRSWCKSKPQRQSFRAPLTLLRLGRGETRSVSLRAGYTAGRNHIHTHHRLALRHPHCRAILHTAHVTFRMFPMFPPKSAYSPCNVWRTLYSNYSWEKQMCFLLTFVCLHFDSRVWVGLESSGLVLFSDKWCPVKPIFFSHFKEVRRENGSQLFISLKK